MSDSEHDIDDELLALAGAGEKKQRKRPATSSKSSSSKRRKPDVSIETDSEDDPESEEDESNHPYPLEGKYKDAADKKELMQLSEIQREEILAQRLEELQRIQDKRNLDKLLKDQNRVAEVESVSKAAKRQHTVRGATKEKTRKLDELKASRKAKDERKRTKTIAPRRDRSSEPTEMEMESDEEEDGQISKLEQEEDRDKKLFSKINPEEEPITIQDLEKCRLTRDTIVKHCMAPWFEDYVKGAWVRYLIGTGPGPVYRICEVLGLCNAPKPYKVNDQLVGQTLDLKHGKSQKEFHMDKVSNAPFDHKEFLRLVTTCETESVKLPSKRRLESKVAQMHKLSTQPMTESDVAAMLARKNALLSHKQNPGQIMMEKARLTQLRSLALKRHDYEEAKNIDAELEALAASNPSKADDHESSTDLLAKVAQVNERNRKANLEAVRKAELIEAERKRKERQLAASGLLIPHDPSARLKTVPRLFNSATPSRSGTPNPGTPLLQPQPAGASPVPPLPPSTMSGTDKSKSFETALIDSIEVDLGDF